jgi:two-component system sensor histidine kinase CiaH
MSNRRLPRPRVPLPPQSGHAARVALAATLLVGVVYAGCVTILDRAVTARLVASVDTRLREQLADGVPGLRVTSGVHRADGDDTARPDDDEDVDQAPVFVWRARPGHGATRLTSGAPDLPAGRVRMGGGPATVLLGTSAFRLDQARRGGQWLVAGQSLAEQQHTLKLLRDGEAAVAPVLLLAMFAGSLVIGLRALSPVEQSRRRQLEFTADASHELRTPLSVISAEIGITLSAPRPAADYEAALLRIEDESKRLRRIVEDLLWLARFDSQPPPPGAEPLDLFTIATQCAERFQAVAHSQSLAITLTPAPAQPAWISAPPEWIDRLSGVLADNACRYAGPGGSVRLSVAVRGNRVSLTVEDSGPGIATGERDRLFDRFHRVTGQGVTQQGGGAGLGLAIADSIVRSTAGHWRIGESALGGALFEVSWRAVSDRRAAHARGSAPHRPDGGEATRPGSQARSEGGPPGTLGS